MDKTEQAIFAYLRKSTKKEGQDESIANQKGYIINMAKELGIDENRIVYFIDEGYSGFKGAEFKNSKSESILRKRKAFQNLIDEIRKLKQPCKLLVWNCSRFARDTKEGNTIYNLLGNNNEKQVKIESVHFFNEGTWDKNTNLGEIIDKIQEAFKYSQNLSKMATERKNYKLEQGLFPTDIKCPKGLENLSGALKENENMPFIRKAFEMKAEGETNKKIHAYLTRKGIKVSACNMHTILFQNRLYIGEYTLPSTGEVFTIKFYANKKPISLKLFNKIQDNKGKKRGKYGDKQKHDLIANILKTSEGRRFSMYIPKGKTQKQYQNSVEKVYISQNKIFEEFKEVLNRIYLIQYKIFVSILFQIQSKEDTIEYLNQRIKETSGEGEKKLLEKALAMKIKGLKGSKNEVELLTNINISDFIKNGDFINTFENIQLISKLSSLSNEENFDSVLNQTNDGELEAIYRIFNVDNKEELKVLMLKFNTAQKGTNDIIKRIVLENGNEELKEQQEEDNIDIANLEQERKKIEKKLEEVSNNAIMNGFTREQLDKATRESKERIESISEEINELKNNSISDKDLDKFITSLQEIFELVSNMHCKGKNKVSEEDMLHLIKMTTFELKINPSKGLDIALFEGLKNVFYCIGIPTENGTPISALRRPHPNH